MPQYAQGMLEHIQNIVEYTVSILECTLRFLMYIQSVLEYIQSVIRGHCLGMLWVYSNRLEYTRIYSEYIEEAIQ